MLEPWRGERTEGVGCEDATVPGAGSEEMGETPSSSSSSSSSSSFAEDTRRNLPPPPPPLPPPPPPPPRLRPNLFSLLLRYGLLLASRMRNRALHIEDVLICKVEEWSHKWAAWAVAARLKRWYLWVTIFVVLILAMPTIFLDENYHNFADQRLLLPGIPHTLNVISSIPFLFVGLAGIIMFHCKNYFRLCSWRYLLTWIPLFVSLTIVGFGSSYYHLNPRNTNCDTLPMIFAFTSTMGIFIVEWFDDWVGQRSFTPPFSQSSYWLWAAGFYLLARVGEVADKAIYRWTLQSFSGHTIEHLFAAVATALSLLALAKRSMVIEPESPRSPVHHQLKFAFIACLWVPRMIYLLVLDMIIEVPITIYELIILLWEFSPHLVARSRFLLRSMAIEPESLRSPVHRQLKFAFMVCLWVPRMICLLVLDIVTEVPITIYELIILLWEFCANLVDRFRFLVMTSEKPSVSKTRHHGLQLMMQHSGLWGMDDYKCKVHKFLESELRHDSVLGLWGASGVGKTRLLLLIGSCYGDADSPFRHVIAFKDGDVRDMQHYIAAFLKLDWSTMSSSPEHCRANIISEHLKHDSFLLLLDDVQNGDLDLASIGLPMPLGHRQKVILTSESQAVCGRMGCADTIEMKCLGEEDAWNLFKHKVGVEITDADAEIHEMAKLMVSACGGLPRAICSIGIGIGGVTCCGKNPDDWWFAYERFKANKLPGCSGLDGVAINLQQSAGASEAHVSNLQTTSSSSQSSAGPSKRGKTAVPRTTAGPRRGLRSDKSGYVELALPYAPPRRKVPQVPLAPTLGGAADSRDAEDPR